jgi:hypothetical protein
MTIGGLGGFGGSERPLTPALAARLLLVQQRPFRSGSARLGRSQKDGLPFRCCGLQIGGSRSSTRAGGSLRVAPFLQGASVWLDEGTAHLDVENEGRVNDSLRKLQ